MRFDDCLHDSEAKTGALDRSIGCARGTEESLEEPTLVFVGRAHAVVRDLDHAHVRVSRCSHSDMPARRSELQRVRDEIVEDLGQPRPVGVQLAEPVKVKVDLDAFLCRSRPRSVDCLAHELLDVG
ncbi:MAG: hypothetical protein M3R37_08730, partial [Actinomycetota bacterium]|nr:hypothetical protein [Actinomycetota bacterium]